MNSRQIRNLTLFKRVYDFVTSTPPAAPLAPPSDPLIQLTAQLQDAIAQAEDAAGIQQSGNTKVTTSQYAGLRRTLRTRHMIPIRHVARVLAKTTPGLDNLVQLPSKSASNAALLAAAHAAVTDVVPYQTAFIAKGLATDFISKLATAISALEQAADASVAAKRQKFTATSTLASAMANGRDIVISIGHVVQEACDQDPASGAATRDAWELIQRIHSGSAAPLPVPNQGVQSLDVASLSTTSPPRRCWTGPYLPYDCLDPRLSVSQSYWQMCMTWNSSCYSPATHPPDIGSSAWYCR